MKLHEYKEDFKNLISIAAEKYNLPETAIERDYYIVLLLQNLSKSEYAEKCVFKGGTSLSKCYPGSIDRFSEDIDLTFLGMEINDKQCDKTLKRIEEIMTVGANIEKINSERNKRNKSTYVWYSDRDNRVKLEIGSNVKPDPYSKKILKSYIHEYLEEIKKEDLIKKYELEEVTLNVLNIERTFIDKVMAVKRHALCGTLKNKVRHIYDVVKLYELECIKEFLKNADELKKIILITKQTDSHYLEKRNIYKDYDARKPFNFSAWKNKLDGEIKSIYENLHQTLLFSTEKQDFSVAINIFESLDNIFKSIDE